jgi:hypothetical protein
MHSSMDIMLHQLNKIETIIIIKFSFFDKLRATENFLNVSIFTNEYIFANELEKSSGSARQQLRKLFLNFVN